MKKPLAKMDEEEFWRLIGKIDTAALERDDDNAAVRPLQEALTAKSEMELVAFAEQLAQKLYDLDGEMYAKNAGDSGNSDDGFLYVRCYVVAKGRKFYVNTLAHPAKMPQDQWCEALLYAHLHAWASITGRDESEWPFETALSYESGSNERLWNSSEKMETTSAKKWWEFWR